MSEFIKSYRAKHPEYSDLDDSSLTTALHGKFVSDTGAEITLADFSASIGYQATQPEPLEQAPVLVAPEPLQQQQPIPEQEQAAFGEFDAGQPVAERSMLDMVSDKLSAIGGGIASGVEGALPQAKLQIAGMMQSGEARTPQEFIALKQSPIGRYSETAQMFDDYEKYKADHEARNPISSWMVKQGKRIAAEARGEIVPSTAEKGSMQYYSEAITGSVINMIPALGVSILGRRPDIGLGVMLAQSKGGSYEQGRMKGLGTQEAEAYSLMTSAAEAIPSALPIMAFMKPTGQAVADLVRGGVSEAAQEVITAALQSGIDKGYIDPNMTWGEAVDRMIDGAIIGAGAGTTISLATGPLAAKMDQRERTKNVEREIESEFDRAMAEFAAATGGQAVEALSPDNAQMEQTGKRPEVAPIRAKERMKPEPVVATVDQVKQPIDEAKPAEPDAVEFDLPAAEVEAEKPTKQRIVGKQVVEAPIAEIQLSEDIPQFKEGANVKGVVEPLGGKFERTGVAPIQIWVRSDGRKEVISGRHRLDLAERSGETTIPAQYHYEDEGFSQNQAAALDAILNIREGQGKVKDYVDFIKAAELTEEEANAQGILARQTGKRAYSIASKGSDTLIASHRVGVLTDEAAVRIADAAPGSEALQAVGIKAITEGKTIGIAENLVKAVSSMTTDEQQGSGDLFGFDDSAMIEAERMAREAVKRQSEIQRTLSAVQGAAKRPDLAAKEGIDVKDPEAIKRRIKQLKTKKQAWDSWHTNPRLVADLKGEGFGLTQVTEQQRQDREQAEQKQADEVAATKRAEEDKAQADKDVGGFTLSGSDRTADVAAAAGQDSLFDQPAAKVSEKAPVTLALSSGKDQDLYGWKDPKGGKGFVYSIQKGGEQVGFVDLSIFPDGNARIEDIVSPSGPMAIGTSAMRGMLKQIRELHPEIERLTGERVSGSRRGGKHGLEGSGVEISVDLKAKEDIVTKGYSVESFNDFRQSIADQTATAASIKADAERVIANKDQILEQLGKLTKAQLQEITQSPRSDFKKPQMVKQAYQRMLSAHALGDGVVTIFGGSKSFEDQVIEQVQNQTQTDVDQAYEKQRQYRAERERQKEDFVRALTKPESLADYKRFIQVKGKDKLSTEQLKAYDELVANSLRDEDKPKPVKGEAVEVAIERAQTTHTKTGDDLFVVKLVGRVEKDHFKELSGKAKALGGYYSTYAKDGAIPGFQFKTIEAADSFDQALSGKDIDTSNINEAKTEVKQAHNADKLIAMADKLEAAASEEVNRDRQTNTGRRASMAANATERAYKKLALAKTVRNIAIGMQAGELQHLSKMSQVTQLEELMSIQKRAIPADMMQSDYDGYSMNYDLKPGTTIDSYIANVVMPQIDIYGEKAESISDKLKGKTGFMRLGAELRKLPRVSGKAHMRQITPAQLQKLKQSVKAGHVSDYELGFMLDQEKTVARLAKVGITTDEQLRAAIRELDSLSVEKQKEDPLNKLERDLIGKKIEGYFPTPRELVEQMIDYADIQPGNRVLEPSAGKGNIADVIRESAPGAELSVIEFNSGLNAILTAKGYSVVGNDFLEHKGEYDRIVMNPPFENFADIDHVKHAFSLLRPGGKLVAIMGAGVKNSRKKAVEFRQWVDEAGSYIEDLPAGSFKSSDRPTGVATVMVTLEKNDDSVLSYKRIDTKPIKPVSRENQVFNAPGHNFIGMFRSLGIPARREFVLIEGRKLVIPDAPQRIEPIMRKLVQIAGRRIYFGKIKGKSAEGFYRPSVGEIRTRRKNDIEVLAHELAHYLDIYSNVTLPNFKRVYQDPLYSEEVKALSYTDATPELQQIEGFAEFVRLWLTNSTEAQLRAPGFYQAFTQTLARDRKLLNPMRDMQDLMHKFFFQGPDKLGQALIGGENSFSADFNQWAYRRDSRIRQQTIDRFHAARKIEQELTGTIGGANESAWKMLRIANGGAEGISDHIMNYGTVNFNEAGDLAVTGASLHDVLQPVKSITRKAEHAGDKKIDLLMRYFAGRRALELHRQKRENLIPKETAMEWAKLGRDYPVFESIHKEYQEFNNRMMDFYVEAGLITVEGRQAMEKMNKDYVPFNRIRETLEGGGQPGAGFQRLKGGTANLNDILLNIQDGVTANVRAALSNRAKQRLYGYISGHRDGAIFATKLGTDSKLVKVYLDDMMAKISKVLTASGIEFDGVIDMTDPELLTFWQHGIKPVLNESGNIVDTVIVDGKKRYYEVQDPLLQEMLLAMNPESYSSFMNVMFGVKNFFTRMITLGVEFTGANLVRDTVGATFISKNGFIPFITSFQGMHSFITRDQHFKDFMRSGGGYSSFVHASTKEGAARRKISVDEFGVSTIPQTLLSAIDNISSAFEYGTRIGEFRLAKKNGKSDMDAGFAAREISTDFSVLGANRFLTGYIRTVPFLNAMVQSQDRVFREAVVSKQYDGNPAGMAMKAFLGITVPTLILYLVNKDDEDYQEIPDYEKRTNWHFKVGDGQFIKVPRPYDVGFIYATMPELFFKWIEDDKGKEFADGMIWTMTQMYGIDGTPAMMTGWWDLVKNEKWTGAPVVPKSMENVAATEQYSSNTSETFIRLGEATGLSPIKAEHMFKAYTGYLGGYLMWGTDKVLWDESKFGEKPSGKLSDNIFLRRFLTTDARPATSAMEKFFDLKEKSDKIVATFKQTTDVRRALKGQMGEGKFKDDKFFGLSSKEKGVLFALNDSMNQLIKVMYGKEGIKTAELAIKHDPKLTGDQKRAQMDKLWLTRNKAFMQYYTQANAALQKAKAESEQGK